MSTKIKNAHIFDLRLPPIAGLEFVRNEACVRSFDTMLLDNRLDTLLPLDTM